MKGENISLRINPSGDVEMYESAGDSSRDALVGKAEIRKVKIPSQSGYVIMSADFREDLVGGKSLNLVRLKGKLPEWIHLPSSVAIPFGVAERTLSLDNNKSIEERIRKLLRDVEDQSAEVLSDVRKLLLELEEPPGRHRWALPGGFPGSPRHPRVLHGPAPPIHAGLLRN